MRIIFLGTAAAIPTASRNLACMCIEREGDLLMFDAGEGTQRAFAKAGLGWNREMQIFITHLHGDHCLGLPGLIQTMSMQDRSRALTVYGPDGTSEYLSTTLRMLRFSPPFRLDIHDIYENTIHAKEYSVSACRANHTIPALAYLFTENDKPGTFHPEKARMLGVPRGPMWKELQRGRTIQIDGCMIRPDQVLGDGRRGIRIGYSGDTSPTTTLERFYAKCDHLVFDSTFTEKHAKRARATGHSTAAGAANLAYNAGVKHLILTHFSARYADYTIPLNEARRIHPTVTAASDMLSIRV